MWEKNWNDNRIREWLEAIYKSLISQIVWSTTIIWWLQRRRTVYCHLIGTWLEISFLLLLSSWTKRTFLVLNNQSAVSASFRCLFFSLPTYIFCSIQNTQFDIKTFSISGIRTRAVSNENYLWNIPIISPLGHYNKDRLD